MIIIGATIYYCSAEFDVDTQTQTATPMTPVVSGADHGSSAAAQAALPSVPAAPADLQAASPLEADPAALITGVEPHGLLDQLQQFLLAGGPVVWILLVFSVIASSIILLKIWQLAQLRPESVPQLERSLQLWRDASPEQALDCLKTPGPVAELMTLAMTGLQQRGGDSPRLRDELDRVASLRLNQLRAYLRPLDVIAMLSPLLGLLGTVLGMIGAFQQMEAAGSQVDPSVLSGGIWQALLTTAVGIAVAIPVTMAHSWLERKTERVAALMSDAVTRVFTSAPAQQAASKSAALNHAA
jgi:biopolymer transport protein ExbB